jgi:hypothetical protein
VEETTEISHHHGRLLTAIQRRPVSRERERTT